MGSPVGAEEPELTPGGSGEASGSRTSPSEQSPGGASPPRWLREWGELIAKLLLPLAIVWVGSYYSSAIKRREVEAKFVELAIGVLREVPDGEGDEAPIRDWAVEILEKYSGVDVPESAREAFRTEPLPWAGPIIHQEFGEISVRAGGSGTLRLGGRSITFEVGRVGEGRVTDLVVRANELELVRFAEVRVGNALSLPVAGGPGAPELHMRLVGIREDVARFRLLELW